MSQKVKILAVDDEEFNLDILTEYLAGDGYEVIGASDGDVALKKLDEHPDVGVIVLDRMMPNMNGMEVLEKIKKNPKLSDIPVVMQTAAAASEQVLQGIQAGVYYYLTKPYKDVMLLAIVKTAIQDTRNKKTMREEVRKHKHVLAMMEQSRFRFRTLEEAKNLGYFIANCFPDPEAAVYGLTELLINAVEHGNLNITYAEKKQLMMSGTWQDEIERRLALDGNKHKSGYLLFEVSEAVIRVRIRDNGDGFDWRQYMEISPSRVTDPHGRGIATSRIMSFDTLEYLGSGNEVLCTVKMPG